MFQQLTASKVAILLLRAGVPDRPDPASGQIAPHSPLLLLAVPLLIKELFPSAKLGVDDTIRLLIPKTNKPNL